MPYETQHCTYDAHIAAVTFGVGDSAVTLGGENVMPLQSFDGPIASRPAIGLEIDDVGIPDGLPELAAFYKNANTVADQVCRASELPEADFVALKFSSALPTGADRSVDECVEVARAACALCGKPLVVEGCRNSQKDRDLFEAIAKALQGESLLLLSADIDNYENVVKAAVAHGHAVGLDAPLDADWAKHLHSLVEKLGVPASSLVVNLGSAAAGYGFEYVASTIEYAKTAALMQGDDLLRMPVVTSVAGEAWSVKESVVPQDEFPEWGPAEARGIQMEIATATACLAAGSNAVILKHPQSARTVSALVESLM